MKTLGPYHHCSPASTFVDVAGLVDVNVVSNKEKKNEKKNLPMSPRDIFVSWALFFWFFVVLCCHWLFLPLLLLLAMLMMVVWMLAVVIWWKEGGSWRNKGEESWQRDKLKVN